MSKSLNPNSNVPDSSCGIGSIAAAYHQLLTERRGSLASEAGGELQWLAEARERAFKRWREEGLPTRKSEEWKYTSVSAIAEARVSLPLPAKKAELDLSQGLPPFVDAEAEFVFLDGVFMPGLSRRSSTKGLSIEVLSEVVAECVESGWNSERRQRIAGFRAHLESSDADRETVFAAINTSFMQDVALIHVEANVAVKKPVVITHLATCKKHEPGLSHLPMLSPRLFASVDRRAEVTVLERFCAQGEGRYLTNSVSDLRVAEGGRLSYSQLQTEAETADAFHIGTTRVRQGRDSATEAFQFSLGAGLSRQDLHVSLEGEGAETVVDGLYMVQGAQHVDNHTVIEHVVANTASEQIYKGVLADQARAVFNGKIHIHPGAQKSNAAQLNNNLVLSPKAEVDTKPELEIYADDVKASHGATIGQIDPDHVFYLESRAIAHDEAVKLLARGYAMDVVYRLKAANLHRILAAAVDAKFEAMHVAELARERSK